MANLEPINPKYFNYEALAQMSQTTLRDAMLSAIEEGYDGAVIGVPKEKIGEFAASLRAAWLTFLNSDMYRLGDLTVPFGKPAGLL